MLLAECLIQTSTTWLWHGHTCAHTSYLSSSRAWISNNVRVNPVFWVNICMWRKLFFFPEERPSNASMPTELELEVVIDGLWGQPCKTVVSDLGLCLEVFSPRVAAILGGGCVHMLMPSSVNECPMQLSCEESAPAELNVYIEPVGSQTFLYHVGMEWHGWGGPSPQQLVFWVLQLQMWWWWW